ncbi:MAG TPA: aldehyde dehydrogenase family protein [Bacteriovoracaceae bacterium]|nr:aldehyde dehydrogenase family protein [Bacteriovoracaceae bacterium]
MFNLNQNFPLLFTDSKGVYKPLLSPNTGEEIARVQWAEDSDIHSILKKTRHHQKLFRKVSRLEVAQALEHVSQRILDLKNDFAHLISLEGGKPLKDALVEVERAALTFKLCAEESTRISGEMIPMERSRSAQGKIAFTLKEPIGPVLAISAFNHPLNLLAHQVGCALASGCVVLLKPAPGTPLNAYQLKKLFLETNLPDYAFTIIPCDIPEIETLAKSTEINYVSFIGSAKVGWELRSKLSPGTRLGLEHGGIAPAIVCEDADIDKSVNALIKGAFYHAGQVCISTQRIFIHNKIEKVFTDKFLEEVKKLKTQDATLRDTDVGPLIRPSEVTRIQEWISEALAEGAKLLTGNIVSGNLKQFLSPTVLSEVKANSKLMSEEVFGPVVCINTFSDMDTLLEELSDTPYIFESCLFTESLSTCMKVAKELPSMSLVINEHNAFRVDWMPFGGHQKSGLGMGGVKYSIEEMTRTKQIIINS